MSSLRTLPGAWSQRWASDPAAPTLRTPGRGPCSAGEFEERTREAAAGLADLGVAPGDRVLWSAQSSLVSVVAGIGALRLGAVLVPINPALSVRELAHIVGDVRPRAALDDVPEHRTWLEAHSVPVAPRHPAAAASGRGGRAVPNLDATDPQDPALIVYTSGTTGAPKGAVLRHANLAAGTAALEEAWRLEAADRLLLTLPLFHVHGLCAGLFSLLAVGGSVDLQAGFHSEAVVRGCRDGATLFFGVPTMYHRLAAASGVEALARLRLCVSGSAPLPATLWQAMADVAGLSVLERYGMTETLLTLSNPYEGDRRPGTVGLALPGVEFRLDPVGEGDLLVRGPSVFDGYFERPAASADCFVDGWFRTGDVASIDDDGYVSIRGRRGDLILSGGFNVYPAEVEEVLRTHPAVQEVAVTGTESEEWGQEVTAWVVRADASVSEGTLAGFAAERLVPYKRPRRIHFVDSLPTNAMGKVARGELR